MTWLQRSKFLVLSVVSTFLALLAIAPARGAEFPGFNVRGGAQTFSPLYGFEQPAKTRLVETAERIHEMGSDVIKLGLFESAFAGYNLPSRPPEMDTLKEIARDEPSFRAVLDMPFRYFAFWAYPVSIPQSHYHNYWRDGLSAAEAQAEYNEIRELAEYLLTQYDGTGKMFLLGHWEGDWAIRGNYNWDQSPSDTAIQGMIDWLNNRQQAVADARAAHPGSDVKVLHYAEVNVVTQTRLWATWVKTVTADVLPHVTVDLVSYSAYDSASVLDPSLNSFVIFRENLDYIASKAVTTSAAPFAKKVFIGEYGSPTSASTPAQQAQLAQEVLRHASNWGCPFILYWQMYDNEGGGYWLVNSGNQKQPAWDTHQKFLGAAHALKNLHRFWLQANPAESDLNNFSLTFDTFSVAAQMDTLIHSAAYRNLVPNEDFVRFLYLRLLQDENPAASAVQGYVTRLASGTPRATILNEFLNSAAFSDVVSNTEFVTLLFKGALRRETVDTSSAEFQQALTSLSTGTTRSALWRQFLDKPEFLQAELPLRNVDTRGSRDLFAKYFLAVPPAQSTGWMMYR